MQVICVEGDYQSNYEFILKSHMELFKNAGDRRQLLCYLSFAVGCAIRKWTIKKPENPHVILYCKKIVCTYSASSFHNVNDVVSDCKRDTVYDRLCAKEELEIYLAYDKLYRKHSNMPQVVHDWFFVKNSQSATVVD